MINEDTLYETGRLATKNFDHLEASFNDLPADPYAEKGLRSRRYSRYRLDAMGNLVHLPQKDFIQVKAINKAVGDVERHFEEIDSKTESDPTFVQMFRQFRDHTHVSPDSIIEAHQIRWHCDDLVKIPAPEGIHQDGFDFIAMFMVETANLDGGDIMVYPSPNEPPIFKKKLDQGEYVVLNDKRLFHYAAPLVPEANHEAGHWDLIVLTAKQTGQPS